MKYDILGIKVDKADIDTICHKIIRLFHQKNKKIVFYVNAHSINIAAKNPSFKSTLNYADLVYCGGLGPVIAARLLKKLKLKKTTTPDFIYDVFRNMEKNNKSIFFLGSKETNLREMKKNISHRFPKLKILGSNHGYFSILDNQKLIVKINKLKPDLLLVGMGSPKQEEWIVNNYKKIDAKIFWSVGAIFEIFSGKYKRLPKVFNDFGFEWIYRLIQEPRRLWKRYLIGNVDFFSILFKNIFRSK